MEASAAEEQAVAFVEARGFAPRVARGVVRALKDAGMGGALLPTVQSLAGRWEARGGARCHASSS